MTTGALMLIVLVVFTIAFLAVDLVIYLTNNQTLTQLIITKSRKDKKLSIALLLAIVFAALFFIEHFEIRAI